MEMVDYLDIQELSDEMLSEIVGGSGLSVDACI